jgi:very-short-patch-repair endonuclease
MNVGRMIAREVMRSAGRTATYRRLQYEAATRPGSRRVHTPAGEIYMSPIEAQLYEAMQAEGLSPIPQYCISGYFVDFAFPDVWVAVEADGAAYHEGPRLQRDHKRDWILRRAGWTVKRFHGTTIYHKAANCAYVIRKEVEGRRMWAAARAREEELRRQARRDAILRPFRRFLQLLKGVRRA